MNKLVTLSLVKKDVSELSMFPAELMSSHESKIVDWVSKYYADYGETPSLKRLKEEHPHFVPVFVEEGEVPPLGDVRDQTIKRKLAEYASSRTEKAYRHISETGEIPLEMYAEIERMVTIATGVSKYTTFDREMYFRRKTLDFPFKILNRHMKGIGHGDYVLVIGRLGTGKSTLAQWITKDWFLEGRRILYISCEMLAVDIFSRLDAMVGKFNPLRLRDPEARTDMETALKKVVSSLPGYKGEVVVPSTRIITPQQVNVMAKNLDVDAIVVDGVYLMQPSVSMAAKWERVAAVSNELKQIALDLRKPLVGVTQIKRGADSEEYDPEDIAYSDALGQDADFIIAIKQSRIDKRRAELQLIKNRYGPEGSSPIFMDFDKMTITDEAVEGKVETEMDRIAAAAKAVAAGKFAKPAKRGKPIVTEEPKKVYVPDVEGDGEFVGTSGAAASRKREKLW